jgi:hypothetical protein
MFTKPPSSRPSRERYYALAAITTLVGSVGIVLFMMAADDRTSGLIVGALVAWLPVTIALLRVASRIRMRAARVLCRSVIAATAFAPGFVAGHGGIIPAPAVVMLFMPDGLAFLAIPSLAVALVIAGFVFWRIEAEDTRPRRY